MTVWVAILGCGYVGLELCRQLSDAGHDVVGVRRSADSVDAVAAAGGEGVQADVTDEADLGAVPDVDALVFAASTGGGGATVARSLYVEGLRTILEHFGGRVDPPDRVVYTSSTGVYGDHGGEWVDEDTPIDPTTAKTRVVAEAERVVLRAGDDHGVEGTVVRLAGLYGPTRYRLDRYLEGPVTEGYLNTIHRDDAAGAIAHVLVEDRARGDLVLAVDDEPVEKWTFADWLADQCGVERPPKRTVTERLADEDLSVAARRRLRTSKRCANDRLKELGYSLRYPTFREGYGPRIRDYTASG